MQTMRKAKMRKTFQFQFSVIFLSFIMAVIAQGQHKVTVIRMKGCGLLAS